MKKIILATAFSLLLATSAAASSLDSAPYHTKAADRYAVQLQFSKALHEYDAAIAKDGKHFPAWLGKIKSELALGKLADIPASLNKLDDASDSKAEKFEYLLIEGQYLLAAKPKRWIGKLKENFFKAKKIDSGRSDLHLLIARAYRADGKESLARKHYSKVIEIGGRDAAIANQELASMFRQAQASGTGKGWVGDLAGKTTINRATLAAVLVDDIAIQNFFPKRSHSITLPADCKSNTFASSIDTLLNTQLTSISLDAKGLFNPDANVTRFELAKLIQEILIAYTHKDQLSRAFIGTKSPFPDLNANHYAYNAAFLAISRGLMTSDDLIEGNFAGDKTVTGADLLLVLRKLGSLNRGS
ncbi:MAG: hypothetical protein Q9M31_09050 [Mariprofundus sp.]|nr:hypothetical protein [Mariprofundus sp.]